MTRSRFIVVEHHATKARLHWDLRFVMPNSKIWMSFAVRKGIPLEPGKKVLAVRTHDHSEDEALFLGEIPAGEYGAGVLKKWDDGQCIIHKFKPSQILIEFKGKKLKGFYHLINTGVTDRKKYKSQQYILFKGKTLNESSGMVSRIPSCGEHEDTEEDECIKPGKRLPWSNAYKIE
jgi:DNA ligase D-like protein (predicted 3'-phosphoesterase)